MMKFVDMFCHSNLAFIMLFNSWMINPKGYTHACKRMYMLDIFRLKNECLGSYTMGIMCLILRPVPV